MRIDENVPLARYTTLGTGGPARALARPETLDDLDDALRWASERGLGVATVGLGSNLLVADDGVDALVLKLGGELAGVEIDDSRVAARSARRRSGGLSGRTPRASGPPRARGRGS